MNLDQYEQKIELLKGDQSLSELARAHALHLLAREIDDCCWHGWARPRARELALAARAAMPCAPSPEGLDELAAKGRLRFRSFD